MAWLSRWLLGSVLVAALVVPPSAPASSATPWVSRITARNASTIRPQGPDAHGGIGDWVLGNGTLCAVVSDLAHESSLSTQGGVLIDVSHCGRADDHFVVLQPLANFGREDLPIIASIRSESDEHEARIVTSAYRFGVHFETTYSVNALQARELKVVTTIERVEPGKRVFLVGDVTLHGHRQLSPFGLATSDLARSSGFVHPAVDVEDPLAMVRAMKNLDLQVLVGSDALAPGVSYGIHLRSATLEHADGSVVSLPRVSLNGTSFSLFGVFARPLWLGDERKLGLLAMAQTLFMDVHEGERLRYERVVVLGARSDVASVTDQIWAQGTRVSGRVSEPSARLFVSRSDGVPVTHVRPEADGSFGFRVPPGAYRLRAVAPGGREIAHELLVAEEAVELPPIELGPAARLRLPQIPAGTSTRLVFEGLDETATPRFHDDFRDFRVGSKAEPPSELSNNLSLAGIASDLRAVTLAPGNYRVYATRGLEYGVTQALVTSQAGKTAEFNFQPPARVLQSRGWLAADLHVHSGLSDDSTLDPRLRIASFAAQGADILVSTEHDNVVDLAPLIREMGLEKQLHSIIGVEITGTVLNEVTPSGIGHHNLFPLHHRPLEYRGGAPSGEGRRLRTLIASARASAGESVFQLNHPRPPKGPSAGGADLNFFSHLSVGTAFDPTLPLSASNNKALSERDPQTQLRDLDFDVIELMNGPEMERYFQTRADWFSLLLQGEYRPGTANSDSHNLRDVVALPLNYVRMEAGTEREFDEAAFVRAIRAGHSYGTTGPLLDLKLADVGIGGLFSGTRATLHLRVDAAHWVPVSQARVYINGELSHTLSISSGERLGIVLSFEVDSFVTVEVEGVAGEIYRVLAPGFTPFAFTNPIFVDADRDGVWTSPGLPDKLPETIRDPLASLAARRAPLAR